MNSKTSHFDVLVIGGGPAGLSTLFWCAEFGLRAVLFEKAGELGGQLLKTFNPVTNYLGIAARDGKAVRDLFVQHMAKKDFTYFAGSEVVEANLSQKQIVLVDGERFTADAVVIATGVRRRRLGVPGEEDFYGRGILESGVQERNHVEGKTVAIVGGGDAAIENALILSERASKVIVIHRRRQFAARKEFMDEAQASDKVEFRNDTTLTAMIGGAHLEAIEIKEAGSDSPVRLEVDALLIRIGTVPNSELFQDQVSTDRAGFIVSGSDTATEIPGVYAVGDITNRVAPTISAAVGQGAIAARSAADLIAEQRIR